MITVALKCNTNVLDGRTVTPLACYLIAWLLFRVSRRIGNYLGALTALKQQQSLDLHRPRVSPISLPISKLNTHVLVAVVPD
jgi:hypothetical protein